MQEIALRRYGKSTPTGILMDQISTGTMASVIAVVSYATIIGISAQFSFHLAFTPVPITLQTFAVLVGAAALGAKRAFVGTSLYLGLGLMGLPWFADASSGLRVASSPTMGYLLGFIFAAFAVGALADRGWDRRSLTAAALLVAGNLVIYIFGASWLAVSLGLSPAKAFDLGVTPFLVGDVLKAALAVISLPAAWWGLSKLEGDANRPA